ncbi:hypothetical protein KUCAC02_016416 [Chaenocephalus aceratus]|nr:hypothetical protein KUCAC02_016416 [Chaenocephalus aceratus]
MQPHPKLFPRTWMGDRRRSFKADWYKIHPWLEYSKMSDSAHCYACRHFSPPNSTDTVFDSPSGTTSMVLSRRVFSMLSQQRG